MEGEKKDQDVYGDAYEEHPSDEEVVSLFELLMRLKLKNGNRMCMFPRSRWILLRSLGLLEQKRSRRAIILQLSRNVSTFDRAQKNIK